MGITSLQVCMDSSDWLQGTISEDGGGNGMDSSSPMATPTGGDDMLACSRPLIERRLRPQHEQSLKCPRCESTHTKFCYYNNYSLSQPRYFCKTCRRYWTKGGTLRNIPVGGGCRKNKKVSSKKSNSSSDNAPASAHPSAAGMSPQLSYAPTDLHLAFPDQLHFHAAAAGIYNNASFMLDNSPTPIDFMDNKYEALLGAGHDAFMGGGGGDGYIAAAQNGGGIFSPFGFENQAVLESCQRLMLPYNADVAETKPNAKILSLEWHDHDHGHNQQQQQQQQHACNSDTGKDAFGYSFGSWTGLMNTYGSSAANPLV